MGGVWHLHHQGWEDKITFFSVFHENQAMSLYGSDDNITYCLRRN